MLHSDIHIRQHWRVYLEAKHSEASDRVLAGGRRIQDVDHVEMQQVFFDQLIAEW